MTHNSMFQKSRIMQRAKVLLGEGLLTSEGQFHIRQRRLAQPAFHRQRIAGYAATMVECAERAGARWTHGETRDISEEMMRLTLAIVAQTLFGAEVEQDADEIGQAMTDVLGMFNMMLIPFTEYLQKMPLPTMRRFERARSFLDRKIYAIINERRESGDDRGDLLSMLLLAQDEQGDGGSMTDTQVRDEALTLFMAGHETTANALTWTWYLLSQHPEVERRLHDELRSVLSGRSPAFDDFPQLRYTEMVFAESMRLYPPAWAMSRLAMQDYEVGDYHIPAGSICMLSPYVMHRRPEYFPIRSASIRSAGLPRPKMRGLSFRTFPLAGAQALHWRTVCVDRRDSSAGGPRPDVANAVGAGPSGCASRANYAAHEIRNADETRADLARSVVSYFPYGGGPRLYIGERFAWTEGILLLAALGQTCGECSWSRAIRLRITRRITLRTKYGMRMRLERI